MGTLNRANVKYRFSVRIAMLVCKKKLWIIQRKKSNGSQSKCPNDI